MYVHKCRWKKILRTSSFQSPSNYRILTHLSTIKFDKLQGNEFLFHFSVTLQVDKLNLKNTSNDTSFHKLKENLVHTLGKHSAMVARAWDKALGGRIWLVGSSQLSPAPRTPDIPYIPRSRRFVSVRMQYIIRKGRLCDDFVLNELAPTEDKVILRRSVFMGKYSVHSINYQRISITFC